MASSSSTVPAAPAAPPRTPIEPLIAPFAGAGYQEDIITPKQYRADLAGWIARRKDDDNFGHAVLCRVGIAMEFLYGRNKIEPVTEKVAGALWGLFKAEIVRMLLTRAPNRPLISHCCRTTRRPSSPTTRSSTASSTPSSRTTTSTASSGRNSRCAC